MKEKLNYLCRAGPVLVMCLCTLLLWASSASALLIDDFTYGGFEITAADPVNGPGPSSITKPQSGLTNVIDGDRHTTLTWQDGDSSRETTAGVATAEEVFYHNNNGVIDGKVLVEYGWNFELDEDFTEGGTHFGVGFRILFNDLLATGDSRGFKVIVTSDSDSSGSGPTTKSSTKGVPTVAVGDPPLTLVFYFNDAEFAGVDWTDVDTFAFEIDGPYAHDIEIDIVETMVPEPLTMLGMFLGLGSIGAYIRRRRMS